MSAAPEDNFDQIWGEYRAQIAQRLNRDRPTRYARADQAWMEPTIGFARARMPADEATVLRKFARDVVIEEERKANRKANRLVKRFATQGVLFWDDLGPLPFTLDESTGFRVRFDAATPEDFERRAAQIRESADRRREAEYLVAAALDRLAAEARSFGYERVAQLGDQVPPHWTEADDEDEDDEP